MARPAHGGNLSWAARLADCSPNAILDFSASINPLGTPRSAIEAIQAALPLLRDYPDPNYQQVRSMLAQIHQLSPDWILPGNGSAELLTWACWDLAELANTVLFVPAFGDYFRALKAFGAEIKTCPIGADLLGNAGLLLNNPHNPTGKLFDRSWILEKLHRFELVVVDEAFMDFLPPDQSQSLIGDVQEYPNLVILRSLTKFYSLPGLRFGYAIAHPDRLKTWQERRDPWSVNILAAKAAEAVLQDIEFQKQTFDWLQAARPQLFEGLNQIPGLSPHLGAANFYLVKSECSVSQLQKDLLEHDKMLIRDCLSFPELGDRYFRVAVRLSSENQRLIDGLSTCLLNMMS
ncbi:threonine-phosphate decarboxylase [Leptolyngbya boryana NIES-2135]|uniref:threonine-phosphate decarboxylase n=1 Tax=Leptolyngbya boryana NIES-2135 TaxID=1973484 RepID=A0A1Z4JM84_LEPBY|nr:MULTISPECIES: threonine-phosphate decarboxylase CobD [Leptolyngbya]BAY57874.1 threonine-phosphate decarboxylase [Leptolyngbya boryana NIES-2135]MBD2367319.1 threonine-phosphate decarboxylase [Leptolyngbya sp. FACHB-161]MBD2373844.1 threonine-phosphate decarboxylase [Leptolyngbya sp. FACHB-238]MBD2398357.1 threonine-phosphate decarboxylase [Leptolyngbya sp. FACHB-239]MBD2404146.1 threonine-phosphate decarboxylase [Leptolyngbya sp. FACHB-402]